MKKQKSIQDIAITLSLIALCLYVFISAGDFKGESGMFPRIVAAITLVLCVIQLAGSVYDYSKIAAQPSDEKRPGGAGFYKAAASLVGYVLLIFVLGYYAATAVYLLLGIYAFGYQKKLPLALIVLGMIASVYLLFTVMLRVRLPSGLMM